MAKPSLLLSKKGRGFPPSSRGMGGIYVEEGCKRDDWVRGTPALALADIRGKRGMRDKVAADG
jgi:hypothetical protein